MKRNKMTPFMIWIFSFLLSCDSLLSDSSDGSKDTGPDNPSNGNEMLIITLPKYETVLVDFIEWKRSRGLEVFIDTQSVAGGVESIRQAIRKRFEKGLTYILLIGDIEDIPSPYFGGAPSDPTYALIEGADEIGDALISRISVKNEQELKNQLNKIVYYEKGVFNSSVWLKTAIVAGTTDFNGAAYTAGIVQEMKQMACFDSVIQILESDSDSHGALMQALETIGANMLVINSHGMMDGFHSIPFQNSHIEELPTFGGGFPFVHGAGCLTGSFHWSEGDCFAESLMKTGSPEKPAGPIAVLAFSRSTDAGPAMAAQKKAFEELISDESIHTIGELCYFSIRYAYEESGRRASSLCRHWHLFGDCSTPIWK